MQAVTVTPGERDSLRILDIPDVQRSDGQVVVRVLQGGLCGTDAENPRYVGPVPGSLRGVAVLVEPMTVAQKALEQTFRIQGRMSWAPRQAVVLGAGPVGILAAAAMRIRGLEVTVVSREPEGSTRGALCG